jgi:hypothetical protein
MSLLRFAVAVLTLMLPLFGAGAGLAGEGGFAALQRHYLEPAQKYEPYAVQKYAVPVKSYAVAPPVSCHEPKIIYRHHRCCKWRSCCSCESSHQMLLPVSDPRCPGRVVQIPVPVPACCNKTPWGKERCGLFVRGVATFLWDCGYMVKVVWLHRGDIVVHTYGIPVCASPKGCGPAPSYYAPTPAPYSPTPAPNPAEENSGPELVPPGGREF